jgi:hypothetical protein
MTTLKEFRDILNDLRNVCCCLYITDGTKCVYCRSANIIRETSDYKTLVDIQDKEWNEKRLKDIEEDRAHNVFCVDCGGPVLWKHQENRCGTCWMRF